MGCNTFASWCIIRFLCKWGLFATLMYHGMGEMWRLTLINYTTHVAPNYKTIFLAEWGNRTHLYMLEPVPLASIRTNVSMRFSSHALRCETGCWGTSDQSGRLCTLCPKQVRESEYHTLIQCSAFDHIRLSWWHSHYDSKGFEPTTLFYTCQILNHCINIIICIVFRIGNLIL